MRQAPTEIHNKMKNVLFSTATKLTISHKKSACTAIQTENLNAMSKQPQS